MNTVDIMIPEYTFDVETNPYEFHLSTPREICDIANKIELAISSGMPEKSVLVRGIQSGHYDLGRDELIKKIKRDGTDIHGVDINNFEMHAVSFEIGVIKKILEGFHKYKPKSEERPQYPVDIWMIYQLDAFDNIEYIHPRLKVITKDKWRLKKTHKKSLLKLVVVN